MNRKPWTSGPRELLDHAIGHLRVGGAFDYRIALISIDNAVELAIKTYLGLPKRVRGCDGPPRQRLQEAGASFPALLDLLEEYGEDKLNGVDLGDIEVYHRLRNQLYHDGNGVTVDPDHVDGYLQLARILVGNLLGVTPESDAASSPTTLLGELVALWGKFEQTARPLAVAHLPKDKSLRTPITSIIDGLVSKRLLSGSFRSRLDKVARARNEIVHGMSVPPAEELKQLIDELGKLLAELARVEAGKAAV
jgi:hypothetical protein